MKRAWLVAATVLGVSSSPLRDPPASTAANACATCHAEIARAWEGSAHHRSATDPLYVDAFALEPLPFCRACHAPSADPGIGCEDCHTNAHAHAEAATRGGPRVSVGTEACAKCHEFPFPDGTPGMQRTATEHAASAFAKVACAACHMKDHTFAITDAMIRSALVADVARAGPAAIAVRLAPGRVGHAFPTGDLFRRLVVEAELVDESGIVHASRRRDLARSFGGAPARVELDDTRVGASLEPCFEMDFAPVRGIAQPKIHLEIRYERVAHPLGPRPDRAEVASRLTLLAEDFDLAADAPSRACP